MPTSEARILANRTNSLKSTGPTSVSGRRISAGNSLKHGMAGRGVVLPESDAAEVERRNQALQNELAPATEMGQLLVHHLAMLSVRMEKGARHSSASSARRVRHATEDFDEQRIDRAEDLLGAIAENPRRALRKLRRTPEGVDLLVAEWGDLRADLTRKGRPCWTASHLERAAGLLGVRSEDARASGIGALSRAAWGDFEALGEREGGGLDDDARKAWARARLVERIDEATAELEAHRETLDLGSIEQDRAEAGDVAWFDPSREASLARRYESEAQRHFFKTLNELRRVEAEAAERPTVEPASVAEPDPAPAEAELASSREEELASSRDDDLEIFDRLFPPLPLPPPLPFRAPRPGDRAYEGPSGAPKG
jgi:hypothetical protein